MKKIKLFAPIFLTSLSLFSCNDIQGNPSFKEENNYLTYQEIDYSMMYRGFTPSKGDVNILVVPVEFKDSSIKFSEEDLNNLNVAFNSTNSPYWESVKSFYNKSSYNQLNLNFNIADKFVPEITKEEFINNEKNPNRNEFSPEMILKNSYKDFKIEGNNIDYTQYDSDKDGFIDGIWLIYSDGNEKEVYVENKFWAYTNWILDLKEDIKNPVPNTYANCSQIFLKTYKEGDAKGIDAHTLIHEQGHMLGLDDYYTYDGNFPSASGGKMMMDLNIGDHDSFSKFSLGWIKPKLINKSQEITIKPFESSGEALIISNDFTGNPFDEYLILEYYTPTGLNKLDSEFILGDRIPEMKLYDEPGIILYHVDARLIDVHQDENPDKSYYIEIDNSQATFDKANFESDLVWADINMILGNNSYNKSILDKNEAVFLIENINQKGNRFYRSSYADNDTLYQEGEVFSATSSQRSFFNRGKMHNGQSIDISFKVEELTDEGATISFSKK